MSQLFASVMRQALKTFDSSQQAAFNANLSVLKQLVDQLTYRDIHLNAASLFTPAAFNKPNRAPCTFIHIFENDSVSMSVFIMRAGYTMPLHDHPMMHGLLRGIYGKLLIRSYTQRLEEGEQPGYDSNVHTVPTVAERPVLVSEETGCAVLTPTERNFHEITAVDGAAAFFDILSPPYDADIPVHGMRSCRFYRRVPPATPPKAEEEEREEQEEEVHLEHIPTPQSYYCDSTEAPETVIKTTFVCSSEAYASSASSSASATPLVPGSSHHTPSA